MSVSLPMSYLSVKSKILHINYTTKASKCFKITSKVHGFEVLQHQCRSFFQKFVQIFNVLAPCQWGSHPDSHEEFCAFSLIFDDTRDISLPWKKMEVVPAKFGARRSLNDGVVSGQTRPQTLLKL